ncbi:TIR-like protein FxsC [Bailinhaonella thermotolerans]|uniref:TIR domain-containing protein n=1 Tax=Bailinhaonella thermotolerans TaxID=1070861 RepID=A0A3A4B379_9ACTN|nr:TIR-like protein FxsC [Bailinhaonella thermotolerans]RJL32499.1 TIR domain-containing protein [Bailinhaonella thermotolerans]
MAGTPEARPHPPYFFLSYARVPHNDPANKNPNIWVERFYRDVCHEILQLTSLPHGVPAGFMDTDLATGVEWDKRLALELATCQVFVPLYSPRYFESEQCGKEWAAFDLRRRHHMSGGGNPPEVIVPAYWVPVPEYKIPESLRAIQFSDKALGTHYKERGLYGLMKISRFRDHYKLAVDSLAKRIIAVADEVRLPPAEPCDYAAIKSVFERDEGRRFQITVVSYSADTVADGRDPKYYGTAARDWNPYPPEASRALAEIAAEIVRRAGFEPDVGTYEEHRRDLKAASPACPALVLVDPWTAADPHFREVFAELDRPDRPWVGLAVPWNDADAQTTECMDALRAGLREVLPAKIDQGRPAVRKAANGLHGLADFESSLTLVISELGSAYLRHVQAPQVPGTARPRLYPPSHSDPPEEGEP